MAKKRIGVVFGGCSSEYGVSLQSASEVIRHLDPEMYEPVLLGITRQGEWWRYRGPVEKIENDTWFADESCVHAVISPSREVHGILEYHGHEIWDVRVDVVFPVMHGKNGEDGSLQGLLQLSGIPFVGSGTQSSALCMDKDLAHLVAQAAGVKTPSFFVVRKEDDPREAAEKLGYPLFVKPARAGSSFGITRVEGEEQLQGAMALALEHDAKVVLEEAVAGFEVGCAVLGNEVLTIGEVDEIELQQGFFDYTEKYTLATARIHMPARISLKKTQETKETAMTLYRVLECRGLARVDMFLTPKGEIIFNEVNTLPGLTAYSRYPSMLRGIGMSFEGILHELIELAGQI